MPRPWERFVLLPQSPELWSDHRLQGTVKQIVGVMLLLGHCGSVSDSSVMTFRRDDPNHLTRAGPPTPIFAQFVVFLSFLSLRETWHTSRRS